jgi:hypothetical protein
MLFSACVLVLDIMEHGEGLGCDDPYDLVVHRYPVRRNYARV